MLIRSKNYLDIKPLLYARAPPVLLHQGLLCLAELIRGSDVGCKTVANMIKGKTPEQIRTLFNITNEYLTFRSLPCYTH